MKTHSGKHFDPDCFNAFVIQLDTVLKIQGMLPDNHTNKLSNSSN
jgi:HD-GYP domain-containing protein (c-di-GMP phosphodiesterase class II)